MNVLKSLFVILLLVVMLFLSVLSVRNWFVCAKKGYSSGSKALLVAGCVVLLTLLFFAFFLDYTYPFERHLKPILFAEFEVPQEYVLDYPGQKFWHGAYQQFGLYAESFYFDPEQNISLYGFSWPPMNFEKYSYIFTYGQKIESLSYNVWDTIDEPVRTGAKVGHMKLEDNFDPSMVYIYQIPKIRIENDINNKTEDGDASKITPER